MAKTSRSKMSVASVALNSILIHDVAISSKFVLKLVKRVDKGRVAHELSRMKRFTVAKFVHFLLTTRTSGQTYC